MELEPQWEYVSDRVMGGVSNGKIETVSVDGRTGTRLTGLVSLENNGGFVQMAFNLPSSKNDASAWTGVQLEVYGNDEAYDLRLRTTALTRPWQSFRATFVAETNWQTVKIPFTDFVAHRTDATFDATELRRIGILAVGRVFEADVVVSRVGFYRE